MSKKWSVAALLGMGTLLGALNANATDYLFKDYAYASALADYKEADGYYDCSEEVGGVARCMDEVSFLDHEFTLALIFSSSKLITVELIGDIDSDAFAVAFGTLSRTFKLTTVSDGFSPLDLVKLSATETQDELDETVANYTSAAAQIGTLTYTFYEGVDQKKRFLSAQRQLQTLPDNVRAADLEISGNDEEAALIIRFFFPKLEANKISEAARRPAESF